MPKIPSARNTKDTSVIISETRDLVSIIKDDTKKPQIISVVRYNAKPSDLPLLFDHAR